MLIFKRKFVLALVVKTIYDVTKRKGWKHAGGFMVTSPVYIPIDPATIKCVLQRDFEHFSQRVFDGFNTDDHLTRNLAFISGDRWKYHRVKFTPAFTPGKIKVMFDGIVQCAHQMHDALELGNKEALDIGHVASCFFADVIGVSAYGLECNSFKNPSSKFITRAKKLMDITSLYRFCKLLFIGLCPKISKLLGIRFFDKESTDFFINLAKDTAKFRKHNKVLRKDLFQLMLDAETELNVEEMDDEASISAEIIKDMASQIFLFFVAGFETSSVTLTYCLYELAENFIIQDKLRGEVDGVLVKYEGNITYDAVMEMTYLSQVVDETLRKYPPAPVVTRRCTKEYKMGHITIDKGLMVIIPTLGLHRDADYYPDPEKFDPDRFSEENKHKIIPFTYLPFGEGPRNCPAYRFGLMQLKVGLVVLLQHYIFVLNNKTKLPIEIAARSLTLMPKSALLLDLKTRI